MISEKVSKFINQDFDEVELIKFLRDNKSNGFIFEVVDNSRDNIIGRNIVVNAINGNEFVNIPESRKQLRYILRDLYDLVG